nr:hypothetical protein Iba_chr05aCG13120 [Ipomoea batatas]GMC94076.1 hypothetical protein Iba_chr05bCG8460 [Ipomoea batatas]GMD01910.1 hypothetical protein Iba_chr05fCG11590 [Ipomoea batatas]GME17442.1 hypothetical protein Iba_scaffold18821CG0080 [Ipomoea batatas]
MLSVMASLLALNPSTSMGFNTRLLEYSRWQLFHSLASFQMIMGANHFSSSPPLRQLYHLYYLPSTSQGDSCMLTM